MKSIFEFLKADPLTADYFPSATQAEKSYALSLYSGEETSIRVIAENIARDIADQQFLNVSDQDTFNDVLRALKYDTNIDHDALELFYDLKQSGNQAAHQLAVMTVSKTDKETGLRDLKRLYKLLAWFVNTFYDQTIDINAFHEPKKEDYIYTATLTPSAAERSLIYIQSAKTENGHFLDYIGSEKIGKASVTDLEADMSENSNYLRQTAQKRINQYMETAGVPSKLEWAELAYRKNGEPHWFTDKDVHRVLERSKIEHNPNLAGQEWFKTDLATARKAIKAVKNNQSVIDTDNNEDQKPKIVLRPEQLEAVKKTKKAFKNDKYSNMLWNAKMRFGKTLSALQLIKDEGYKHVLIMTHRPAVDESWFEDFAKIGMPEAGYLYGSKNQGATFESLRTGSKPFVYFASLQNLSGSTMIGGKVKDKNRGLFSEDWDLVIIDEAHEGTQTELAQQVLNQVHGPKTKLLELSGTPFNILDQYEDDQVYTWDYTMEQRAKQQWEIDHPHEPNPYAGLPRVNMFTFNMDDKFKNPKFSQVGGKSFNFKEFFKVNDQGEFIYENYVRQFLRNITTPSKHTSYPFSTKQFRDQLRHTLWLMPGVKEAGAMERLLKQDPVLGEINGYKIINVVKDIKGEDKGITDQTDVDRVKSAIGNDPASTKTITLTVRKLTTGITIKPWTGVIFLSNTNSAMQYLQAAFRAQTPYSDPHFGTKTDCFIFDFAPDRALTIMAESAQMNSGVGKRTTSVQKQRMSDLLNFLPIIGEQGNQMKPFHVDSMLKQIKKVYAEKAVKSGFEDDSLYSDELLMIREADLEDFKDLKSIVGKTKRENTKVKVNINDQGLTDEQYDKAIGGQKKPKKERSSEEQAAIDQMNAMKKQRRTLISILRSISIRIPLMIYGMDVDLAKDISINTFVDKVDDQSWEEFMPKGIDKSLFRKFIKYYDPQVFLEAGQIIRQKVKELDNADPIERIEKLTDILGTFRNPDKETVLTPWRVVNMHLGKTVGGLSFFDSSYEYNTEDGESANHWINTDYTDQVFAPDTHILEINSKTGTYPLYMAASLYWKDFQKLNEQTAGKFALENELFIWQKILRENIFCIAKTPMAKSITIRTLCGFQNFDTNIEYVDGIVNDSKEDVKAEAKKIKGLFNNMKFDVIVGNPPYHESDGGALASAGPIYDEFVDLSRDLSPDLLTLIMPSRWYTGGKGLKSFRESMLNDVHIKALYDFRNPEEVFPRTNVRGGLCIFLWDKQYNNKINKVNVITIEHNQEISNVCRDLDGLGLHIFIRDNNAFAILKKVGIEPKNSFENIVSARKPFGLSGTFVKTNKFKQNSSNLARPIKVYGKGAIGFTELENIKENKKWVPKVKVLTARANNIGTELRDDNLNSFVAQPNEVCTETYLVIGADLNLNNKSAENITKYLKTKFSRYLISLSKASQDASRSTYRFVPQQDFNSETTDIDWSQSISNIDQQLYKKYNLSQDESSFIETKVQAMD
ncbi:Eco57I restriction-modification methylase domain-containing protein [Pediococcus acidilactici]|uniref:Eco57I restriction-modification methylase domain-containing protein n=1 Tax=Pediococcus acidilactici TaxID=1254 RepID=UPI001324EE54|nr:Eco57I restriction-modification methylase domain-containing protein [Pediococcus acidilactici]KAF0336110.1 restriction endonuclease [Pediococcus acidilactici]KAF0348057.1 restriction endonuclease [Pediococcus acidilactici]KAF0461537.1 restriction endonuclease [Pediococcus acidilactici]KAF0469099.1 restriction endonuclease [Pediococcus acidilactici]KAF0501925.1 restriction endonuclease [Pediococcus acidilactici]